MGTPDQKEKFETLSGLDLQEASREIDSSLVRSGGSTPPTRVNGR
jgi:hypothetical protein